MQNPNLQTQLNPADKELLEINTRKIKDLENFKTEQQEVDRQSNIKLDQITGLLTLIPAKAGKDAADRILPRIPEKTAEGVCRTTQPGGCMSNALTKGNSGLQDWLRGNLGNLLNAGNAGANAAQLALLRKIDFKLGDQIGKKGLSGAFKYLFENKLLDRAISILKFVTTFHNALQLSNTILVTLYSGFDNILRLTGIELKNEEGKKVGIQNIVSEFVGNLASTLFGAENVRQLTAAWKKANRIYQSGAYIVDSVRSMTDSVRNVAEYTAENTGRIGNALKSYQVISPDAFKWMPEKVDGQSVWVRRLQNLEEAASGIEMVTSELVSIGDNANELVKQKEEFVKSINESPKTEGEENKAVADDEKAKKLASVAPAIPAISSDADKEPDEE